MRITLSFVVTSLLVINIYGMNKSGIERKIVVAARAEQPVQVGPIDDPAFAGLFPNVIQDIVKQYAVNPIDYFQAVTTKQLDAIDYYFPVLKLLPGKDNCMRDCAVLYAIGEPTRVLDTITNEVVVTLPNNLPARINVDYCYHYTPQDDAIAELRKLSFEQLPGLKTFIERLNTLQNSRPWQERSGKLILTGGDATTFAKMQTQWPNMCACLQSHYQIEIAESVGCACIIL